MSSPLQSLIQSGTKLWLDSVDPDLVLENRRLGATGATSNPIIVADLLKSGRFDSDLLELIRAGKQDEEIAWVMADRLVHDAQQVFLPVWRETAGNDGYVSFELDPLLEDPQIGLEHDRRVASYIDLGKKWSSGHPNRMIKIPATPAGIDALEELAACGVTLNVTLVFTFAQYRAARDAVWRGAQRRESLDRFKSVYSIFVSRVDVYTERHIPELSPRAQGMAGIVNAKRIWAENQAFWKARPCTLDQEIVFASTGTKRPDDPPTKYVAAFAGSDIETNPPGTNQAVERSGMTFDPQVDQLPADDIMQELERLVDWSHLEQVLMEEGIKKFADPQHVLLALIAEKRTLLSTSA